MKKLIILLICVACLVLIAIPSLAAPWQIRNGEETIDKGQVVEGDLLFTGERLEINGEVKGDLIVWAGQVVVNGKVGGSILGTVWDKLTVNGEVQGNVRGFATEYKMNGKILGRMTVAAITLNASPNSVIEQGVLGLFTRIALQGVVNGPVEVTSSLFTNIGGRIQGNLKTEGAPIDWKPPVEITGSVNEYSEASKDPATIKDVTIGKGYLLHQDKVKDTQLNWFITFATIVWFIGSLLAALILFRLFPRTLWNMTEPSPAHFRRNMWVGLLSFFITLLLILILPITYVGIPLAILLGLFFLILFLFSWIPIYLWFGRLVFKSRLHPSLMIILGGLLLMVFTSLPFLGIVLWFVFVWLGFGMIIGSIRPQIYDRKQVDVKI